jgi:hypothetical protein
MENKWKMTSLRRTELEIAEMSAARRSFPLDDAEERSAYQHGLI